jgi:uncharacterized protein
VKEMYNRKVLDKMNWHIQDTHAEARKDPRIGIIKMFENAEKKIPIYVNLDDIVRYHFGVFSFTGGGKSCLLSNVLRRILLHTKDTKVVIFDISSEYPFLLMDVLADPKIPAKVILESPVKSADEFYVSVVKPKDFENDYRVKDGLSEIFERGIITHYIKPQSEIPRYGDILQELSELRNESTGKPHYVNAIEEIHQKITNYLDVKVLNETQFIDESFVSFLSNAASDIVQTFKISEKAGLYSWATTRDTLLTRIRSANRKNKDGTTTEQLRDLIEGESRLTCVSISDPYTIKQLVIDMSKDLLQKRKKQFKVRPYVLLVFDEAQEFIPDLSNSRGIDNECSKTVEILLRQGRKYGLGGCIATQRIAY